MKSTPKQGHQEAGPVHPPCCPPPDPGFPQAPGCPTDPPPQERGWIELAASL